MKTLKADKYLIGAVFALLLFGLIMITSIGVPKSIEISVSIIKSQMKAQGISTANDPSLIYPNCNDARIDCYMLFKNHIARMIIGLLGLFIVSKVPYRFWKKTSAFWYGAMFLLLILVLILGSQNNTFAKSWLVLFNTSLQPTEFAKLGLIFYLAHWFERKNKDIGTFQYGFLPFCIVTSIILFPVLLQPDLGSALVMGLVVAFMFFAAGAKLRHLFVGILIVMVAGAFLISFDEKVNQRFQAFTRQDTDCAETYCWQTEQANLAVGTGGFWGKGLTQGVQKAYWLPQATDDFIFAASAEELGFIRIFIIVILYGIIGYRGYWISVHAPDKFTSLTAVGITSWVVIQAYMNIAINIGLMPVTGITLPFISYGGSSLISTLLAVGILLQISKHTTGNAHSIYRRGNRRTYSPKLGSYSRT